MFDPAPENLYSHDPLFERTHSPLEHPAEGMEELGLAGPAEGLDRATADAFDPDSYTRWHTVEDPYDDEDEPATEEERAAFYQAHKDDPTIWGDAEDDEDAGPLPRGTLTCADLDRRGHWDVHDCCQECHTSTDPLDTADNTLVVPHPKGGNVIVRACCALHEYLHNHLVKGHEDFLGDLFGGDD